VDTFSNGELTFDVIDAGPADGPVVVLLHGFPQFNDSWDGVIARLTAQGYRCLAPNQRGYSPGARPRRRRDYRITHLVSDVLALVDETGADRVHLVGHDWGAAVAWAFANAHPERLASLNPLSVPHPAAFLKALLTSRQVTSSWYIYAFQLPSLPERVLIGDGDRWQGLSKRVQESGQTREYADRDARRLAAGDGAALTGAINWYRAALLSKPNALNAPTTVPTMFLWGDQDKFCKAAGALACGDHVDAPYRFERFYGASHWLPEEQTDEVSRLLLEHFAAYPV
jgi:pimeloyl-ACP methyl ester carboxylesterase